MKSAWTVEFLHTEVEAEFLSLPQDLQARLVRISDLIESHGLENLGMPYLRHIQDKLWELRGKGKSGIARAVCHPSWQASDYPAGFCEEDAKDTTGRCSHCIVTDEGD